MAQRVPWINRIGSEMQYPMVDEILTILARLVQPHPGPVLSTSELKLSLSMSELPGVSAHAESLSRLRSYRPVMLRASSSIDVLAVDQIYQRYICVILEEIYGALFTEYKPSVLYQQLLDNDITPYSGAPRDAPDPFHSALRWNIWRLYGWLVLGILPSGVCLINDLPIEILGKIFELICQPLTGDDTDPKVTHIDHVWEVSSHLPLRLVCKKWQFIVDTLPVVWSHMVQGFGDVWAEHALVKSRDHSLSVAFGSRHFHHGHILDSVQLLLGHAARFADLVMSDINWDALAQLTSSFGNLLVPRLASLTINAQGPNARLPRYIFADVPPPALTMMSLANCKLYTTCSVFRSALTSLTLIWCEIWPCIDDMLDTLRSLPALSHLDWCMSQNSRAYRSGGPYVLESNYFLSSTRQISPVPLPHLTHIALECPAACSNAILGYLSLPATGHVRLLDDYSLCGDKYHDLNMIDDILSGIDASLGAHYSLFHPPSINSGFQAIGVHEVVLFGPGGRHTLTVHGSTTRTLPGNFLERQTFTPDACTFTISLLIPDIIMANDHHLFIDSDVICRLLHHILAWPSMRTTVQRLVTDHWIFAKSHTWPAALRLVPQLTELHIEYSASMEDSSNVSALAGALIGDAHLLAGLRKFFLGPLTGLDDADRDALLNAMDVRRKEYGHPAICLVLVNPYEWLDETDVFEMESRMKAADAGWIELE